MYISELSISNFRNFEETTIRFNEGINTIIGHNNAGKSNLLKALSLVFNTEMNKKLSVEDFSADINTDIYFELKEDGSLNKRFPPKVKISSYITQSTGEHAYNELVPHDNNTIYEWRIQTSPNYIAQLTYEFFLPDGKETQDYKENILRLIKENKTSREDYWKLIKQKFIHKYISRIYGGNPKHKNKAKSDDLRKFDYQFLNAIRDVESELFTGKNTLLKDVLKYFLDHKIEIDQKISTSDKEKEKDKLHDEFLSESADLINKLKSRIDTDPILKYSKDVGASMGGIPGFDGSIDEIDMFSSLRLMVEKELNIKLPATHNGLGYNNLLYISILLAKMQMNRSNYVSQDDQKVFPMLIIEEPEAHLHPSMQFKFLKFLRDNLKANKEVRQCFITTHSTHITSAVELDEIICINQDFNNNINIAYPGKVFDTTNIEDQKSKAYVKRFLDATKSDMLFANRVILVEGIAEQLLMNSLAKYINKDLEDYHIAVININGRYFNHFLKLFDYDDTDDFKSNAINRKIACITDADPTRKDLSKKNSKFKKCYPFELNIDTGNYEYSKYSSILENLSTKYENHENISIFSLKNGKGKTFEYELAINNSKNKLLLTESISNKKELEDIID